VSKHPRGPWPTRERARGSLIVGLLATCSCGAKVTVAVAPIDAGPPPLGDASVLQGHLHATRDGAYVDPEISKAGAAGLKLDPGFKATYTGQTYAQPLYVENLKPGQDAVFIVTQTNEVDSFDAKTGATLWKRQLGAMVPPASLGCHQPPAQSYGILSTPIVDTATRTLFTDAFITPDKGTTKQHMVYALSIDDGGTRPGWPVDVASKVRGFEADIQHNRGSLMILGGTLYVPFSGLAFDCDDFHGWIVGISTTDPTKVTSWSTSAYKGGIWGALANDGTSLFFSTGNSIDGLTTWGGGNAVMRLSQDLEFSGSTNDYFTPSNWEALDVGDYDLGSSSLMLFDLPGANPSALAVAMGKFGTVHLVERSRLGGIGKGNGKTGEGLYSAKVASSAIAGNPATYVTAKGRYIVLRADGLGVDCPKGMMGDLIALHVAPTSPPTFSVAWCATSHGQGSPMVTTTDGQSDAVVWVVSAQGTNLLLGFDADTGESVFDGGGVTMTTVLRWTSPIIAKGRFFVGATGKMYAFNAP